MCGRCIFLKQIHYHNVCLYTKTYLFYAMVEINNTYRTVHLNAQEKEDIQNIIKKVVLEDRIAIDEHIYKGNRAEDRWGINPFQLFEFLKQILTNPDIKRKELHDSKYFPERYLCESKLDNYIYPCIIGIEESDKGLIVAITILNRKIKR